MFTGIIECLGEVVSLEKEAGNVHITVKSPISHELKIDQSVAHSGICLTVVALTDGGHVVTAIQETIDKTNLAEWKVGTRINLERCLKADGRLDGHIVQGHVDTTGVCTDINETNGSWAYTFQYQTGQLTVEKGSICVNGVSLTVVNSQPNAFSVAIIPYTYEYTSFHQIRVGDRINLEFDIVGKYISKLFSAYQNPTL